MQYVSRLCLGVATAIALSLTAQAADMRAPVSRMPTVTWTGWYAGVSAGYGWSNSHVDPRGSTALCNDATLAIFACTPNPPLVGANSLSAAQAAAIPITLATHPSGAMLGAHIGY